MTMFSDSTANQMCSVRDGMCARSTNPNEFVCSKVFSARATLVGFSFPQRGSFFRAAPCQDVIGVSRLYLRAVCVVDCCSCSKVFFPWQPLSFVEAQKLSHALHQMFKASTIPFLSFFVDGHRLCCAASCTPAIRIDMSIFESQSCLSRHNLRTK